MARAYACADDSGPVPLELEIGWRIEDIGATAIIGNDAPVSLIRRVTLARKVYSAYTSRQNYRDENGSQNWAEWAGANPDLNHLLSVATLVANDE